MENCFNDAFRQFPAFDQSRRQRDAMFVCGTQNFAIGRNQAVMFSTIRQRLKQHWSPDIVQQPREKCFFNVHSATAGDFLRKRSRRK
jgi:hypothetical protein